MVIAQPGLLLKTEALMKANRALIVGERLATELVLFQISEHERQRRRPEQNTAAARGIRREIEPPFRATGVIIQNRHVDEATRPTIPLENQQMLMRVRIGTFEPSLVLLRDDD